MRTSPRHRPRTVPVMPTTLLSQLPCGIWCDPTLGDSEQTNIRRTTVFSARLYGKFEGTSRRGGATWARRATGAGDGKLGIPGCAPGMPLNWGWNSDGGRRQGQRSKASLRLAPPAIPCGGRCGRPVGAHNSSKEGISSKQGGRRSKKATSRSRSGEVASKRVGEKFCLAPRLGLEPRTYRLTAGRSTIELSGIVLGGTARV